MEKVEGIQCVEPNYIGQAGATPSSTTNYINQWGVDGKAGTLGIGARDAWDISTGTSNIRVGIIDTGIAPHRDLNANLAAGVDFTDSGTTTDTHGHGTHIAGIIGGVGTNGGGIVGVNWNISLVPLKIATGNNWTVGNVINAINYARDAYNTNQRIHVLNFSGWNFSMSLALKNAIQSYPGLFVCIAGNGNGTNINPIIEPNYPGSFNCTNQITVGSIDSSGNPSSFSNIGSTAVHVFAPGGNILSTVPTSVSSTGYAYYNGTSMAAPHVAGAAALPLSHNPNLTAVQLRAAILNNTFPVAALNNLCVTGGRLNANAAIRSIGYETTNIGANNIQIDRPCFTVNGELSIPETLNGRIVTQIGISAFANQQTITNITIPNSIISIGESAFAENTGLKSVTFESGSQLQTIGNSAFANCINLGSYGYPLFIIPSTVTSIGDSAFYDCRSLRSINIPEGITRIGTSTFFRCYGLTNITIPNSVTNIADSAFQNCANLVSIDMSKNVTSIGSYAFNTCRALTSFIIPNGVTSISNGVFASCTSLASITLPNNLISIGDSAFGGCWLLKDFIIPNKVTNIGDRAFSMCFSLTDIIIPDSVTSIGNEAFFLCESLTSIIIPKTVTNMGFEVFYACGIKIYAEVENRLPGWNWGWDWFVEVHYYSETRQLDCWRYVNGVPTVWETVKVFLNSNGGFGGGWDGVYRLVDVLSDSLLDEPNSPERNGFMFAGWYKDAARTIPWDFDNDVVTEDITLHAKWDWERQSMEGITFTPYYVCDGEIANFNIENCTETSGGFLIEFEVSGIKTFRVYGFDLVLEVYDGDILIAESEGFKFSSFEAIAGKNYIFFIYTVHGGISNDMRLVLEIFPASAHTYCGTEASHESYPSDCEKNEGFEGIMILFTPSETGTYYLEVFAEEDFEFWEIVLIGTQAYDGWELRFFNGSFTLEIELIAGLEYAFGFILETTSEYLGIPVFTSLMFQY